ncbi:hypothetical protein [Allokutzneria oryzae]|uniref:2OG-Fe(II) oxygenase n=1 Tax=Allokutzneria oryzae TaxID=1378989 RepID=A0ABV6A899_9PSEU
MTKPLEPPTPEWHERWTSWFERSCPVEDLPAPGGEVFRHATRAARTFAALALTPPVYDTSGAHVPADLVEALAVEADALLATERQRRGLGRKWNCGPGPVAERMLDRVDLPAVVHALTGVHVAPPHGGTYLGYLDEGDSLSLHLDKQGFGEITAILCLRHRPATSPSAGESTAASGTVVIDSSGYRHFPAQAGALLVFDGAFTPHGRTPTTGEEQVLLLTLGFRALGVELSGRRRPLPAPELLLR